MKNLILLIPGLLFTLSICAKHNNPDLYINRAQSHFEAKEYVKAESDYQHILKIDSGNVRAWIGISSSYYYQKQYDKAIKGMLRAFQLDPEDSVYSLFLDYCMKDYPFSFSLLNKIIAKDPQNTYWLFVRANLSDKKNDYLSAVSDYTVVLASNEAPTRSGILNCRANSYSCAGMYSQAIADFNEAISIDSTDAYKIGARGDTKRLMGNYSGAVDDFTKAIALKPEEEWFYYRRGWVKDEFMKDHQGGLKDYNQAIAVNEKYAYVYLNRGRLYESYFHDTVRAKADYQMILALDTTVNDVGNCRQYALFHLGYQKKSIEWMNKIIDTYPNGDNYYEAACLYSRMNKPTESIANLKLAFKNGFSEFIHLSNDDDLDNVRNLAEFKDLVNVWNKRLEESKNL